MPPSGAAATVRGHRGGQFPLAVAAWAGSHAGHSDPPRVRRQLCLARSRPALADSFTQWVTIALPNVRIGLFS